MKRLGQLARSLCALIGIAILGYGFTLPASGSQGQWLLCLAFGGLLLAIRVWPSTRDNREDVVRPVTNVLTSMGLLFALIAIQLTRIQAILGNSIANRTGVDPRTGDLFSNPRTIDREVASPRGSIRDRSGVILAQSSRRGRVYTRDFPEKDSSYVCGYFSPLKYGRTGLEASWDDVLQGRGIENPIAEAIDRLLGRRPVGANLELTLDAGMQSFAHQLMADRTGAAILIEVATGAVRVLASNPHFDPNRLVADDNASANTATNYWERITADPGKPLLLRAVSGLYPPGSTFKTITLSAAIETGVATPTDLYTDDGQLDVDGHVIIEANRPDDNVTIWTLEEGLAYSLNVVFAQVGLQLGSERLRTYAERFGFGQEIPFDLPVATGQVSSTPDFLESDAGLADTAFGQGQLLTTPLGMALVAAAIANDGVMMRPFLVDRVARGDGSIIRATRPTELRRAIESGTAGTVQELMVNAVVNGYASGAGIEGYLVGGKTGTAESGSDIPHAWFIGFIGDPTPRHAVAVLLEYGGEGIEGPIAIARELLAASVS